MPSTLGEEIYGEVDGGKTKLKSREFLTKRFAKTFWPFLLILFIHKNSLLHQASWNKRKRILQPWIRPLSSCFPKFKFPISMEKYTRCFFVVFSSYSSGRGLSISKGKTVLLQSSTLIVRCTRSFLIPSGDYRAWRRRAQGVSR